MTLTADSCAAPIGRQLHDIVVPQLFVLTTGLTALHRRGHDGPNEELIHDLITTATRALADLRTISRSEVLQRGGRVTDIVARLREETAVVTELTDCTVIIETEGDTEVTSAAADDLIAFVWESLANAIRHGGASRVTISFTVEEASLRVAAQDNGRWQVSSGRGTGLPGLGRRAARWGGGVSIAPRDGGTCLEWSVPRSRVDVRATSR